MKQSAMLTTASLLTILFMTFHLAGDILFQMSPAGLVNLFAVFVFVVQLYGTLVLGGRRAGYIIIFLGSVLGLVIPVVHMKGTRGVIGGDIGNSGQAFLFVWTKSGGAGHIPTRRWRPLHHWDVLAGSLHCTGTHSRDAP